VREFNLQRTVAVLGCSHSLQALKPCEEIRSQCCCAASGRRSLTAGQKAIAQGPEVPVIRRRQRWEFLTRLPGVFRCALPRPVGY
jgi:hypothetical protein